MEFFLIGNDFGELKFSTLFPILCLLSLQGFFKLLLIAHNQILKLCSDHTAFPLEPLKVAALVLIKLKIFLLFWENQG